jgi:hypothetical protein
MRRREFIAGVSNPTVPPGELVSMRIAPNILGPLIMTAVLAGFVEVAAAESLYRWYKRGASKEEFQRTKAECLMGQTEVGNANSDVSTNPDLEWRITVYGLCMRANGWAPTLWASADPHPPRDGRPAGRLGNGF